MTLNRVLRLQIKRGDAVPSFSLKYVGMVALHKHTEPESQWGWGHWLSVPNPTYQDSVPKNAEALGRKHRRVYPTPVTKELILNPVESHRGIEENHAETMSP